ncbi:MAG TPA: class I SAM-dependent methyltransferase [Vicinamibacterales bacterium]|nr:class I SAM-dependent methyltransferase [Vicinamibacterales bacterium]
MEVRYSTRPQDWATLVLAGATAVFVVATLRGRHLWAGAAGFIIVVGVIAARHWSRTNPAPMPFGMRWVLFLLPHGARYLERMLRPRSGERILEIGPGVGHHAFHIATLLRPHGSLEVVDIQQPTLDAILSRAVADGITNIVPIRADAQSLPYANATFDAAYLSAVLGEIPDQRAALRELHRVLKVDGRLVIAEVMLDPDYVRLSTLRAEAESTGLVLEEKVGPVFAYVARFRARQS